MIIGRQSRNLSQSGHFPAAGLLAQRKAIGADWRHTLDDCAAQMVDFVVKFKETWVLLGVRLAAPPVFVADRELEGAGMGLPVARRIVQRHGGSIAVDGKIGSSTIIRFTFPAGRQDFAQ